MGIRIKQQVHRLWVKPAGFRKSGRTITNIKKTEARTHSVLLTWDWWYSQFLIYIYNNLQFMDKNRKSHKHIKT